MTINKLDGDLDSLKEMVIELKKRNPQISPEQAMQAINEVYYEKFDTWDGRPYREPILEALTIIAQTTEHEGTWNEAVATLQKIKREDDNIEIYMAADPVEQKNMDKREMVRLLSRPYAETKEVAKDFIRMIKRANKENRKPEGLEEDSSDSTPSNRM